MTPQNLQEQEKTSSFSDQPQQPPGLESEMNPQPDYGAESYRGSGKLQGKTALITGGDSGIGRAVALAFAREGADVTIAYLNEDTDAQQTVEIVQNAGRKCLAIAGDIQQESHCQELIDLTIGEFGKLDILVNNAAFQMTYESIEDIPSDDFDRTFKTNVYAMFYLCKAAIPLMKSGSSIINTSSINASVPNPKMLAYAATKATIANFTAGLAQSVAEKGIRVNCVAPGPIWTPLIPSTMPKEKVESFGQEVPMQRAGQPVEVAPLYVMLASDEASYVSGAVIPVTGGKPMLP
jgi:NAD(P)-dependent dehydrogenase (short-subunit alcohol dehydrogenase family)